MSASRRPAPPPAAAQAGVRLRSLGDGALVAELGDAIDPAVLARVSALDRAVEAGLATAPEGVVEAVPTYRSLAILYDPRVVGRAEVERWLLGRVAAAREAAPAPARAWRLPVAYGGADGPDLEAAARATGLSPEEVVALHAGTTYAVYMLGFLPGFAFLGDVAPALRLPRRAEPRTRVPRGAVAVAGQQTAVYPQESPGGWNLLGRCPVPLFDARRAPPALLAPGDRITFEPVSPEAFRAAEADLAAGRLLPGAFRVA